MPLSHALALLAAASAASARAAPPPPAYDTALVTVGAGALTAPAQPDFFGFSLEWGDHVHVIGNSSDAAGVKLSYLQLLRNLQELNGGVGAAGPRLRLGGNSATVCWYNPDGKLPAPSPAENCFLQPTDFTAVFSFLRYAHGAALAPNTSVTWGLNFYNGNNASLGVAEAAAIDAVRARFDHNGSLTSGMSYGLEIGNEVDEYAYTGARWSGDWTPALYWDQWGAYAKNISAALRLADTRVFQGAVFTMRNATWDASLVAALESGRFAQFLRSISYHVYGSAKNCNKENITLANFLSDNTTSTVIAFRNMSRIVSAAAAAGVDMWIGEANSIACGGQYGLSDAFASAMWAVDFAASAAAAGFRGVHFHGGSGGAYSPVTYANSDDEVPKVHPVYVGIYAAAEFLANYSVLLPTAVTASTVPPPGGDASGVSGAGLKAWAARDAANVTRVFCLHRGLSSAFVAASVTVALPGDAAAWPRVAALARLWAPAGGLAARHGAVWAGQNFDAPTDGRPLGPRTTEPVPLIVGGDGAATYTFEVFLGSGAMLVLGPSASA